MHTERGKEPLSINNISIVDSALNVYNHLVDNPKSLLQNNIPELTSIGELFFTYISNKFIRKDVNIKLNEQELEIKSCGCWNNEAFNSQIKNNYPVTIHAAWPPVDKLWGNKLFTDLSIAKKEAKLELNFAKFLSSGILITTFINKKDSQEIILIAKRGALSKSYSWKKISKKEYSNILEL